LRTNVWQLIKVIGELKPENSRLWESLEAIHGVADFS
jgi:hypothetical protein